MALMADLFSSSCFSNSCFTELALAFDWMVARRGSISLSRSGRERRGGEGRGRGEGERGGEGKGRGRGREGCYLAQRYLGLTLKQSVWSQVGQSHEEEEGEHLRTQ